MGNNELDIWEVFGDVMQLQRVDVLMPADAAAAALNAEMNQHRDIQFCAHLPDGVGRLVFDRAIEHRGQQFVASEAQFLNGPFEFVRSTLGKWVMMCETDKLVRIAGDDACQMIVTAASYKPNRPQPIAVDFLGPARGLCFVIWWVAFCWLEPPSCSPFTVVCLR